jgi:uncharacterized protein
MKAKSIDPLRLDVAALAAAAEEAAGHWPLADLPRLAESAMTDGMPDVQVNWHIRGESRPAAGGPNEIWLHLDADVRMALCCQRCLGPVFESIGLDTALRFVPGEDQAAALDAEIEEDVLALERTLDLRVLVEDELLLALPLVPRHDVCPAPLPLPDDLPADEGKPNPFAALARLKNKGGSDDPGEGPAGA